MGAARLRLGACVVAALFALLIGGPGAATAAGSAPEALFAVANPTVVQQGDTVTLGVKVIPGTEPTSTGIAVTAVLTSIGGPSSQQLFDDGTHGDLVPNDNLFVLDAIVAASPPDGHPDIHVTITDAEGRSGSAAISFSVIAATNHAPTVSAGGPYSVAEGSSAQLSSTGSDVDDDTLTYAWDLDGDGTFEAAGPTVTFSAASLDGASEQTVTVRVSDGVISQTSRATVTVTNVAPTASFSAPASASAGGTFTLTLANPADPSAADVAAGLQYAFDCGNGYGAYGSATTATCSAGDAGARSVAAKIRDKDGGVTEYGATVDVVLTFAGLCDLVWEVASDSDAAAALCAKLDAAAAAAARGNMGAKENQLHAFRNQVAGLTGKSLSASDAAELTRLSTEL